MLAEVGQVVLLDLVVVLDALVVIEAVLLLSLISAIRGREELGFLFKKEKKPDILPPKQNLTQLLYNH